MDRIRSSQLRCSMKDLICLKIHPKSGHMTPVWVIGFTRSYKINLLHHHNIYKKPCIEQSFMNRQHPFYKASPG